MFISGVKYICSIIINFSFIIYIFYMISILKFSLVLDMQLKIDLFNFEYLCTVFQNSGLIKNIMQFLFK